MRSWIILSVLTLIQRYSEGAITDQIKSSVSLANNEFALDLLKKLHSDGTNVFFSPLSISAALAMTSLGARGNTLNEINIALHFNDVQRISSNPMAIHETLKDIFTSYQSKNVTVNLANRLFPRIDTNLLSEFLDDVKEYYKGSIEKVDFSSGQAENIINKWVEQQTNNEITNFFTPGSIGPEAILVLVNAIYFKDNWKKHFSRSSSSRMEFHINSNEKMHVMMMDNTDDYFYAKDEELNVKVLEMPYEHGDMSMIVVLPEQGRHPDLVSKLTAEKFKSLIAKLNKTKVKVRFPKYKVETEYSLIETLMKLGVNDLFNPNGDLSGISKTPAHISKALHKAIIRVNEEETEAAAATGFEFYPISGILRRPMDLPEFIADHPFLYFIIDRRNKDIVLFAGALNRPPQDKD